jgi:MYXO-CTERM domain-containing protein
VVIGVLEEDLAVHPVLELSTGSGAEGTVWLGWGNELGADACVAPVALDANWNDPTFRTEPDNVPVWILGNSVRLKDVAFAASVAPDCSELYAGTMELTVDARELGPTIGSILGEEEPDELCALFVTFGAPCTACVDGAEDCLDLVGEDVTAVETEAFSLPEEVADCEPEGLFNCAHGPSKPAGLAVLVLGLVGLIARRRDASEDRSARTEPLET